MLSVIQGSGWCFCLPELKEGLYTALCVKGATNRDLCCWTANRTFCFCKSVPLTLQVSPPPPFEWEFWSQLETLLTEEMCFFHTKKTGLLCLHGCLKQHRYHVHSHLSLSLHMFLWYKKSKAMWLPWRRTFFFPTTMLCFFPFKPILSIISTVFLFRNTVEIADKMCSERCRYSIRLCTNWKFGENLPT